MEHLSRRTTHKVDLLLIVSDPTVRGVKTAQRIDGLVRELDLDIERKSLIINRVTGDEGQELRDYAEGLGLHVAGIVPQDHNIFELDLQGKSIIGLPEESAAVNALFGILDTLGVV
jgi:CO dehydrogenase maturation factor